MEKRIALYLRASAEERYADFVERHPALVDRVPQRMLASYLGISPETLSRREGAKVYLLISRGLGRPGCRSASTTCTCPSKASAR